MGIDKKESDSEQGFQFIEEKLVPRRGRKIRRAITSFVSTVVLAAVFGLVARYFFIQSEPWINEILGIEPLANKEIVSFTTPSILPSPTMTPSIEPTKQPTPTPIEDDEPQPTPSPVIIEQHIDPTIEDYVKMISEIKYVAQQTMPSLVTVTAVKSGLDWFNEIYENVNDTTGAIIKITNTTIFIMASYNEVAEASFVRVTFCDNFTIEANIYNYDSDFDVVILSVDINDLSEGTLASVKEATLGISNALTAGTPIIAVGNPNGYIGSMDFGIVARKAISKSIVDNCVDIYQTNINQYNNSGGFIFNTKGELLGIITHLLLEDEEDTMCTFVSISKLSAVMERLVNKSSCIYLGVIVEDIPHSILEENELDHGIYITDIITDSPAYEYGLKRGDVIIGIDVYPIYSVATYSSVLNNFEPAVTVTIYVKRLTKQVYKELDITVVLGAKRL